LGERVFPLVTSRTIRSKLAAAGLPADVTAHVLRHSFASVAVDIGLSELTIGALLGHVKSSITSKYAHHADAVLLQAADKVADEVARRMGLGSASGAIILFNRGC
jgi:site-specific recombinase XerD